MQTQPARPLILIYGNSPRLQRAERTLRADPGPRVIQIDPEDGSAPQQLAVFWEGVLLYNAAATDPALIRAIQALHPRMTTWVWGMAQKSHRSCRSAVANRTYRFHYPVDHQYKVGCIGQRRRETQFTAQSAVLSVI